MTVQLTQSVYQTTLIKLAAGHQSWFWFSHVITLWCISETVYFLQEAQNFLNKTFPSISFIFPFRSLLSAHHQHQNATIAHPFSPHPSREKCPEIELLRWKNPIQQMTVRSSSEMMMVEVREITPAKQTSRVEGEHICGKGKSSAGFSKRFTVWKI